MIRRMSITLRWVGEADLDRVAETRLRCYAKSAAELENFKKRLDGDPRVKPGDYLLAESGGQAVGTATHVSFTMWCRGGSIPCQGVAWVGAVKTMRRRGSGGSPGVASTVMREIIRHARDRGDVVTALMPFRASYYEHFGYGVVERRQDWTIPIAALPTGPFDSIRYFEPADFEARAQCLSRVNQSGQCSIERSDEQWKKVDESSLEGFAVVDRDGSGAVRGSLTILHQQLDGKDLLKVADCIYEDVAALKRQLHFLSSLKDQFAFAQITLPADVPLNRLLTESQLPHRPVNHPVARCHPYTRMQLRILDHARFLQALQLPKGVEGKAVVSVRECEGTESRFSVDLNNGRIACKATDESATFSTTDRTWAAIATGDLKASDALRFELAQGANANVLDALASGPAPFSHEYF
jgi:predicted acetyltransferase